MLNFLSSAFKDLRDLTISCSRPLPDLSRAPSVQILPTPTVLYSTARGRLAPPYRYSCLGSSPEGYPLQTGGLPGLMTLRGQGQRVNVPDSAATPNPSLTRAELMPGVPSVKGPR